MQTCASPWQSMKGRDPLNAGRVDRDGSNNTTTTISQYRSHLQVTRYPTLQLDGRTPHATGRAAKHSEVISHEYKANARGHKKGGDISSFRLLSLVVGRVQRLAAAEAVEAVRLHKLYSERRVAIFKNRLEAAAK